MKPTPLQVYNAFNQLPSKLREVLVSPVYTDLVCDIGDYLELTPDQTSRLLSLESYKLHGLLSEKEFTEEMVKAGVTEDHVVAIKLALKQKLESKMDSVFKEALNQIKEIDKESGLDFDVEGYIKELEEKDKEEEEGFTEDEVDETVAFIRQNKVSLGKVLENMFVK